MTSETRHTRVMDRPVRSGVALQVVNLRRSWGSVCALDGLSLDVAAGELVALLGPSGCGKSTALRIIAGLDEADSGQVLVDGTDIARLPADQRDMGMVFQAYSLFPNMTARDNVAFGLRVRRVSSKERRRRAGELLELVGLAPQANHFPHQMSGGQQQRVALARALAIEPRVLLLDEPLSALDAKVRSELRDEIRRIQVEVGTTTVFVTHDQEEAFALADRVAVIKGGRLEQIAPPTELYNEPRTGFVAEFVGLTNRLPGEAQDGVVNVLGSRVPLLEGSVRSGTVTALVRPESVQVAPDVDGNGQVSAVGFRGSIRLLQVRLATENLVLAQVSSTEGAQLAPGTAVRVTVRPVPVLAVGVDMESVPNEAIQPLAVSRSNETLMTPTAKTP
jgi:putative spermidine/putrescine transport system ATP-binding protein